MENQLPKKPRGLRKTRRKTPFFALKPRFCAKNPVWGLKKATIFFAHAGEKIPLFRTHTQKKQSRANRHKNRGNPAMLVA